MLMLSSCRIIDEDMSNCPEQIRVYFTYAPRTGNQGIDPADVDRMNLYVFSDKGLYLGEYRDDKITGFSADYYMECSDLLPGKYRFIAWAGKDEACYSTVPASFIKDKTTFDEALVTLNHPGGIISKPVHRLFYADLLSATVTTAKIQRFTMPLQQVTNTINIRTAGLPADANNYMFNIADNNCTYKFDFSQGVCPSHSTFTYTAPCTKDAAGQLHSTLDVLRLSANRHTPQLQIFNTTAGKALYPTGTQSGDLIGLILSANPQNDFDTTHIYDIVITFTSDGSTEFSVSITINGWKVHDQSGELID